MRDVSQVVLFAMCVVGCNVVTQNEGQNEGDEADSDNQPIEEIVVTASKREVTLQDSSLAITALSVEQLENRGIHDFTDISSAAPSFTIRNLAIGVVGRVTTT